jgi:cell division protease FtsH
LGSGFYGTEITKWTNFGNTRDFSEEIAADIDKEVKKIVDKQYDLAKQLLTDNKDMLEFIAKQLLEKETLDEKEFELLMREVRIQRGEEVEPLEVVNEGVNEGGTEEVVETTESIETQENNENNGEENNG